jgi:hypothetical protein
MIQFSEIWAKLRKLTKILCCQNNKILKKSMWLSLQRWQVHHCSKRNNKLSKSKYFWPKIKSRAQYLRSCSWSMKNLSLTKSIIRIVKVIRAMQNHWSNFMMLKPFLRLTLKMIKASFTMMTKWLTTILTYSKTLRWFQTLSRNRFIFKNYNLPVSSFSTMLV